MLDIKLAAPKPEETHAVFSIRIAWATLADLLYVNKRSVAYRAACPVPARRDTKPPLGLDELSHSAYEE
jgi:hypothetical protein